jgi:hypothetical protein
MSKEVVSFIVVSFKVEAKLVYVLRQETVVSEDDDGGWVVAERGTDLLAQGRIVNESSQFVGREHQGGSVVGGGHCVYWYFPKVFKGSNGGIVTEKSSFWSLFFNSSKMSRISQYWSNNCMLLQASSIRMFSYDDNGSSITAGSVEVFIVGDGSCTS